MDLPSLLKSGRSEESASHVGRGQGVPFACQNEAEAIDAGRYPEGKETSFHQGSGR
jgi:hypothetical protein